MSNLRELVREPLRSVAQYDPGPTLTALKAKYGVGSLAKLNWNEDLFGLLPGVREAIIDEIGRAELYPEQAYSDFRGLLATRIGADPDMLIPSHGIQSMVFSLVAAFINPGDTVVLPQPTYGLYRQACEAAGARIVRVPNKGHRFDLEGLVRASVGAKLVVLCDPNNPTGDALTPAEWIEFMDGVADGCMVVVDEAYADYMAVDRRPDRVADIRAGRPVIVLRTFSKLYGLAGLRLGYAIVHPDLMAPLDAVHEPFNVNRLALAAGMACLKDPAAVEERRQQVVAARERFASDLSQLDVPSWPSQANFILTEFGGDDLEWQDRLLRRGFLVRPGAGYGLPGHLRITIGPTPLMSRLIDAIAAERGDATVEAIG